MTCGGSRATRWDHGICLDAGRVDPLVELARIETKEVTPLEVGDAALGDEATDVADLDTKALGHGLDVEQGGFGR